MIGACVAAARNAPMPTSANALGLTEKWPSRWFVPVPNRNPKLAPMKSVGVNTPPTAPEPKVEVVARYFENKDDRESLPEPFAAQNPAYRAVAIAADFGMQYGQRADDEAANTHLYVNRRCDPPSPFFGCTQQPNEPWREKAGAKPEQKIGPDLPVTVELEWRDLVQRIWSKKSPHRQRRDD